MTDKMREEFEAAISIETGRPVQEFRDDRQGESYASVGPKYAWWGWKQSREALVIDLPKGDSLARRMFGPQACGANPLISQFDAVEAIEAAGLKVKS